MLLVDCLAAYCASQGGVVNLTKQIAVEYAEDQIHCNAVCPGCKCISTDLPSLKYHPILAFPVSLHILQEYVLAFLVLLTGFSSFGYANVDR